MACWKSIDTSRIASGVSLLWIGLASGNPLEAQTNAARPHPPMEQGARSPGETNLTGTPGFGIESYRGKVMRTDKNSQSTKVVETTPMKLNRGDDLETLVNSGATVLGSSKVARVDENSQVQVLDLKTIKVLAGKVYLKSLGSSPELNLVEVLGGSKFSLMGTELVLEVDPNGTSSLVSLDGDVAVIDGPGSGRTNAAGYKLMLSTNASPAHEKINIEPIYLNNIIQWALYYPAIIDPNELPWERGVPSELAPSLNAYASGDVRQALKSYPTNRPAASDAEAIYHAAMLLSVGQVDKAETSLLSRGLVPNSNSPSSDAARLAQALRKLIAAVKFQPSPSRTNTLTLASEWMAESYYQQSRTSPTNRALDQAKDAAEQAVKKSPKFSFAWARLAELEFSYGETKQAVINLNKALELGSTNAQALALRGYLFAAQDKISKAIESFNQALAADPGVGNAWLGLGLCHIHQGDMKEGLRCLQLAVAAEPQRSLLRSYLGKAYDQAGQPKRAANELQLAKAKDPLDPTPWLYSALLKRQQNLINGAVRDLEKSQDLNDNRSLFRSGLMLDQDRAVRSANLAAIYRDAGMDDVSLREASRAVQSDYANYSAHLFLANSYAAFLNSSTLRYETPWANELFLANLMSPVGGSSLSQSISQQEYSRLFDRDYVSFYSKSDYASSGDWSEAGSIYGKTGPVGYAVDTFYLHQNGQQPNNDQKLFQTWVTLQGQITPQDSVLAEVIYKNQDAGDLNLYYDPEKEANRTVHTEERQEPIVVTGYRHQWGPEHQTLLLFARLDNTDNISSPQYDGSKGIFIRQPGGDPLPQPWSSNGIPFTADLDYHGQLTIYSGELQHIFQSQNARFSTIVGGRYQFGEFSTDAKMTNPTNLPFLPPILYHTPLSDQNYDSSFDRETLYAYQNYRAFDPLLLTAGVSYDRIHYPINIASPPISSEEDTKDQVSPKAGFIWTPDQRTTVRGGYTRSLGGVSFDQSFRLEPNQVAGFIQSYRSLIPESVAGSLPAATFETLSLSVDHRFPSATYVAVTGEFLESDGDQYQGIYSTETLAPIQPASLKSQVKFREKSLVVTANQLLSEEWALGLRYRLSDSELDQTYEKSYSSLNYKPSALLHQINLNLLYNHPSGFFAQAEGVWFSQSNSGSDSDLDGDSFLQANFMVGYRFFQRKAEARLGVLNLTDQNFNLNPLSYYFEPQRHRTFTASLKLNF